MIPYHVNEAILTLPNVRSCVDRTRQRVDVVTEDGAEISLIIARALLTADINLTTSVEEDIAERRRSLRGFELHSAGEREYREIIGFETRMSFIDKERGRMFHHELHCVVEQLRMGYYGVCRFEHAAVCDEWMQNVLQNLRLRR